MTSLSTKPALPLPPGRFGLPVIGESISYLRAPAGFMAKRQQQYGNIFKTHLFGRPTVALIGADAARFLFANEGQKFEITNLPSFEMLLGAKSIGVQTGNTHQRLRRQLFQAFQPRALASYAITIEEVTQRYLQKWEQMETLTWYNELKKYTLDIAYDYLWELVLLQMNIWKRWMKLGAMGCCRFPFAFLLVSLLVQFVQESSF